MFLAVHHCEMIPRLFFTGWTILPVRENMESSDSPSITDVIFHSILSKHAFSKRGKSMLHFSTN